MEKMAGCFFLSIFSYEESKVFKKGLPVPFPDWLFAVNATAVRLLPAIYAGEKLNLCVTVSYSWARPWAAPQFAFSSLQSAAPKLLNVLGEPRHRKCTGVTARLIHHTALPEKPASWPDARSLLGTKYGDALGPTSFRATATMARLLPRRAAIRLTLTPHRFGLLATPLR
jgi:hypothetical protein